MDLFSTLSIGRETLIGHGAAIATVSDNIANSNTTAFKGQRPEFSDLLAESIGGLFHAPVDSGQGSFLASLTTDLSQGTLDNTGRDLDFAIQGDGYFVLEDGTTSRRYTRAGNFTLNRDGYLTTRDGRRVLGLSSTDPGTLVPINLVDIPVVPTATTAVAVTGNLDSSSAFTTVPTPLNSFTDISNASSFSSPIELIDSLGQSHTVLLHFFHTSALGWTVAAYVDGSEVGGTAGVPVTLGSTSITFGSDGKQATGATLTIAANWSNGALPTAASMDLSRLTGFGSASAIDAVISDGKQLGVITTFGIGDGGTLQATLSNGDNVLLGTLAIAQFTNPYGLERLGDNEFRATFESGEPTVGGAESEGRGEVKIKFLEGSNVDQASEFIRVIQLQRGYQAGAQVVQTASKLIGDTIQIL